jgi:hypothetical protein
MRFWGVVWWGRSRSRLVKTNGKRRFTRQHFGDRVGFERCLWPRLWSWCCVTMTSMMSTIWWPSYGRRTPPVKWLTSSYDGSRSRVLIDATAGKAHVNVQTDCAMATVGTTMESVVNVREVGSMATFSPTTGARMVSMEVQCSPARPLRWWSVLCKSKLQRCVMLQSVPRSARQMPVRATTWWSTLDCSTAAHKLRCPSSPSPSSPSSPSQRQSSHETSPSQSHIQRTPAVSLSKRSLGQSHSLRAQRQRRSCCCCLPHQCLQTARTTTPRR